LSICDVIPRLCRPSRRLAPHSFNEEGSFKWRQEESLPAMLRIALQAGLPAMLPANWRMQAGLPAIAACPNCCAKRCRRALWRCGRVQFVSRKIGILLYSKKIRNSYILCSLHKKARHLPRARIGKQIIPELEKSNNSNYTKNYKRRNYNINNNCAYE